MPRFLIEVPHDPSPRGCTKAVEIFLRTGSHFLSRADWGCKDGDHRCWIILDVDTREEARNVIPPGFRDEAKIVRLTTFVMADIEAALRHGKQ